MIFTPEEESKMEQWVKEAPELYRMLDELESILGMYYPDEQRGLNAKHEPIRPPAVA